MRRTLPVVLLCCLAGACAKTDLDRKLDQIDRDPAIGRFLESGATPYARWLQRNLTEPVAVSENWDLWQLTWSANHLERQEVPPPLARQNLRRVAAKLEELERECAPTVWVHSGYRGPKVNAGVGGVKGSRHLEGLAADLSFPGSEEHAINRCLCHRAAAGICELYVEGDRNYIHLGLCRYLEEPRPLKWCQ